MKRNAEKAVHIIANNETEIVAFSGRVEQELQAIDMDLIVTVICGPERHQFRLIHDGGVYNAIRLTDQLNVPPFPVFEPCQDGIGADILVMPDVPVIVEIYDNRAGNVHYIHDLNPDDLNGRFRNIYGNLLMMADKSGDPLAYHLVSEEDYLPPVYLAMVADTNWPPF